MTFKQTILTTAAASGILLGLSTLAPTQFSLASVAHADTNLSVNFSFGSFYDRLEPYGSWVFFEDRYVFVPQNVGRGWRPYTLGHWSYTHQYGWLWVSNERFGWATYHYGRWGHSRDIGWYWVPGHRWAPAWVAWSYSRKEIAWAPLPPRRGNHVDVEVNITIGDVPDYYWQAVPTSAFLSINLSNKIIRDRNQINTIVQQNSPQTVRIENNIVINNVIQVNQIEQATNTKVKVLEEKTVTTPDAAGKIDTNSVAIFNPDVKVDTAAKPKKETKVEEVVTARKAQGIQPDDVTMDQPVSNTPAAKVEVPADGAAKTDKTAVTPPVDAGNATTDAPADKSIVKPKKDAGAAEQQPVDQNATAPDDNSDTKKKKDAGAAGQPPVDQNATAPADKSDKKKKKDAGADEQQPVDQNAKAPAEAQAPPVDANADQTPVKKNKKGKDKCDPNKETCPPAE